jgi:uncharacterized protein YdeI (YjbR/CyaY-like superfamily)
MCAVPNDIEPLLFADAAAWRAWLSENHDKTREAWVVHFKAKSPRVGLRYQDALEEAIAFGWIDGIMRSVDKDRVIQRYSPRRRGSNWSESNKARVSKLVSAGRMTDAGLEAVEAAKSSGKW